MVGHERMSALISLCYCRFGRKSIRFLSRLAGTPAHNNFDLLIGCTAVVNGLTMVTDNTKDFKRISNIKLEDWLERQSL